MTLRIAMMVPIIPPDFSGAGRRGWRMACGLGGLGVDVTVLTHTLSPPVSNEVPVVALHSWKWRNRLQQGNPLRKVLGFAAACMTVVEALRVLRRLRPDVLYQIGCDLGPQLTGVAGIMLGIPVAAEATLRGSDDAESVRRSRAGWLRFQLLKRYRVLVNISPRLADVALKAGLSHRQCRVIGNDVDVSQFHPASPVEKRALRDQLGLPHDAYIISSVGEICERKGVQELVEAWETVASQRNDVLLLLIGPVREAGENFEYIRKLRETIQHPSLSGKVRLAGEVPDAAPWLRACDGFAFASREEGFGTVLAEAMAIGLPVVVREIPGITQFIVGDAPGVEIVRAGAELGPAMLRMVEADRQPQVSAQLRQRVIDHFSREVIFQQYLQVFSEIVSHKSEHNPSEQNDSRDLLQEKD